MLGGLLACGLVLVGLLVMVGATSWARNLALGVVLCAVLVPAFAALLAPLLSRSTIVTGVLVGAVALALASGIAGFRRYLNHRRELHHWWGEKPHSLKQRVERDL